MILLFFVQICAKQFINLNRINETYGSIKPVLLYFDSTQNPDLTILPAESVAYTLVAYIGIGTPRQAFRVLFDTGSTLFWVRSVNCQSRECHGQAHFDHTKSNTFRDEDQRAKIKYGDGTFVNCTVGLDTVAIGQHTIYDQRVCRADFIETNAASVDGIIGLGPPKGAGKVAEIFSAFFGSKSKENAMLSVWYSNLSSTRAAGQIIIGGIDHSKLVGRISWNSVFKDASHWTLELTGLLLPGGINLIGDSVPVLIDTGTTLVLLPALLADAIALVMQAESVGDYYIVSCEHIEHLPPIRFQFAEHTITLSGNQTAFFDSNTRRCYSIFARTQSGIILGAQFLRNVYTVFDWAEERIGFGERIDESRISIQTNPIDGSKNSAHSYSVPLYLLCVFLF